MLPQTALARKLMEHEGCDCTECGGRTCRVLAEAEFGALEIALVQGPAATAMGTQEVYVVSRGATGRLTFFRLNVPIDTKAEPGARVFKDSIRG